MLNPCILGGLIILQLQTIPHSLTRYTQYSHNIISVFLHKYCLCYLRNRFKMPQQILIYMYLTCLFDHDGILPKKEQVKLFVVTFLTSFKTSILKLRIWIFASNSNFLIYVYAIHINTSDLFC